VLLRPESLAGALDVALTRVAYGAARRALPPVLFSRAVEVTRVSRHGFWLLLGDGEMVVRFDDFPWCGDATIAQIGSVEWPTPDQLYWPELDVDLSIRSIRDPQAFPLVFRAA